MFRRREDKGRFRFRHQARLDQLMNTAWLVTDCSVARTQISVLHKGDIAVYPRAYGVQTGDGVIFLGHPRSLDGEQIAVVNCWGSVPLR